MLIYYLYVSTFDELLMVRQHDINDLVHGALDVTTLLVQLIPRALGNALLRNVLYTITDLFHHMLLKVVRREAQAGLQSGAHRPSGGIP